MALQCQHAAVVGNVMIQGFYKSFWKLPIGGCETGMVVATQLHVALQCRHAAGSFQLVGVRLAWLWHRVPGTGVACGAAVPAACRELPVGGRETGTANKCKHKCKHKCKRGVYG